MHQGTLDGVGTADPHKRPAELLAGVEQTIARLREENRILPVHEGLVQAARLAARRAEWSSGVAASNFLKELTGILDTLLALEAPAVEGEGEPENVGDRVTKLSTFLQQRAGLADVPHTEAS